MSDLNLYAHQQGLERLFNKNQLVPRIKSEFIDSEDFDFIDYFQQKSIPVNFALDLLVQMALHKRASLPTLAGILIHHFDDAQKTVDMLEKCAEADLVDWSGALRVFVTRFTISADVQEELDRFQYPLPMVIRPRFLSTNKDNGYLTSTGSVILKKNHHDDDVCLDHLNRINEIPFKINFDTAQMIKNQWRNLDKPKVGETKADFQKRKRAFEKYDRTAKDVMHLITEHDNKFYLTHKYDKRGRTYCQGYHVNYQGAAWNKAVIEFHETEVTT